MEKIVYYIAGLTTASVLTTVLYLLNINKLSVIVLFVISIITASSLSYVLGRDDGETEYRLQKLKEELGDEEGNI